VTATSWAATCSCSMSPKSIFEVHSVCRIPTSSTPWVAWPMRASYPWADGTESVHAPFTNGSAQARSLTLHLTADM